MPNSKRSPRRGWIGRIARAAAAHPVLRDAYRSVGPMVSRRLAARIGQRRRG